MRAARCDLYVETGADFLRHFTICTPADAVPADAVLAGERIYYRGAPLTVFSATYHPGTNPTLDTVEFVFGHGTWDAPRATVPADGLVIPAQVVEVLAARAAWLAADAPMEIPAAVNGDGSVTLVYDDSETVDMEGFEGSWQWDLFVQTTLWDWTRAVEGTLSVIKGAGRASD